MIHYLTATIEEMFGKKSKAKKKEETLVGMELENELKMEPPQFNGTFGHFGNPSSTWKVASEGSLRYYGHEFVSKPLTVNGMRQSLVDLFDRVHQQLKATEMWFYNNPTAPIPFTSSRRTSVHVHFDVGKYQIIDLVLFTGLYYMLEVFLSHFCGKHRQGNLFCLRAKDAHYIVNELRTMLEDKTLLCELPICHENLRYGSVNFASLFKFGTLEFRLMRGVGAPDDAITWLDALEAIRLYALRFRSTDELVRWFQQTPAGDIPRMVFGEELLGKLTPSNYSPHQMAEDVREGWLAVAPVLWTNTEDALTDEAMALWKKGLEEAAALREEVKERVKKEMLELKSYKLMCENHGYDPKDFYRLVTEDVAHNLGAGFRNCLKEIEWTVADFMKLYLRKGTISSALQPVPLSEMHPPPVTDHEEEHIAPVYDIYGNPIIANILAPGTTYWTPNLHLINQHSIAVPNNGTQKIGNMSLSQLNTVFIPLKNTLHTFFPTRKQCQQLINYMHFVYRQNDPTADTLARHNFNGVWENGTKNAFNPKYIWRIADGAWVYYATGGPETVTATVNPAVSIMSTISLVPGSVNYVPPTPQTEPAVEPPLWEEMDLDLEDSDDDYHEYDDESSEDEDLV